MEHVSAVHTVTRAAEDMDGTIVESESDDTEHKPQRPLKYFIKSSSDTRSKITYELADISVEAIVERRLSK